ncbi:MAG TPA: hypothetical protein VND64_00115 [Pirellulales bacterium]|nr:hypothetical protein [Pirellulales bacterium]
MEALPRFHPSFKHALVLCYQKRLAKPLHGIGHFDGGFDKILQVTVRFLTSEDQTVALRLDAVRVADVVSRIAMGSVAEFVPQDRNKETLLDDPDPKHMPPEADPAVALRRLGLFDRLHQNSFQHATRRGGGHYGVANSFDVELGPRKARPGATDADPQRLIADHAM